MPSTFESFDVTKRNADGTSSPVTNATVRVYDATNNAALANLTTNAQGIVASATLNVAPGTRIRFRIENYQGLAGSLTMVTTV